MVTKRYTLAIDVDITTLASDDLWWDWLKNMSSIDCLYLHECYVRSLSKLHIVEREYGRGQTDYNLASYFPEMKNKRVTPYEFWRSESIYDFVHPVAHSVQVITELAEHFDIVFVTHVKGRHSRSKYNCLERFFGHIQFDYVVTKEKYRVEADAIIDDRNEFLNQFLNKGKLAVKLSTPYTQNVEIDAKGMSHNFVECKDWFEIKNAILSSFPF